MYNYSENIYYNPTTPRTSYHTLSSNHLLLAPSQTSSTNEKKNDAEYWNDRNHLLNSHVQNNKYHIENVEDNNNDTESITSSTSNISISSSYAVEIPAIPSPFLADIIDDKNDVLAFTPLPKKRIKKPKKPTSPNDTAEESPLSKRKRNIVVKDIFETPQKIVNYDVHLDDMFFAHQLNDAEKLKDRRVFDEKHKIYPVWTIAKRQNLIEQTPYRKSIGTDIRKIKPIKHVSKNRHIVHRSSMEEAMFHDVNKPREVDGRTPLYLAAMKGHTKSVRLLYHFGADINQRVKGKYSWEYGKTPLYIAVEKGHLLTAKALIKLGAKTNLPDHRGRTPLYAAAESGQEEMVHLLVHFGGAYVNSEGNEGESPMYAAAVNGHVNTLIELLDMGADVNHQRHDGWSPLHAAARAGNALCARKLCDYGADVNIATIGHRTPLAVAESLDRDYSIIYKHVIKILKSFGAVTEPIYLQMRKACAEGKSKKVLELIRHYNADVNYTRQDGVSPIWIAAQNGHYDCVKVLIDHNADVHQATLYGDTALTIALQEGHFKVARVLRELGANGWNFAHIACEDGDADKIRKLAKLTGDEYVDFNRPDDDGWSPAHVAVDNHNYDALLALSSIGADLNQPDIIIKGKQTPLDLAKYKSVIDGVEKWKPIVDLLKEFSFMETRGTKNERAEKMAAYVIQRIYRLHRKFVTNKMMLEKKYAEKKCKNSNFDGRKDSIFIAPLNRQKIMKYEPINEILDINHEHLKEETKNFSGTPRKEKKICKNKFKEKYGIVD
jgi:ankyrin repeat protein